MKNPILTRLLSGVIHFLVAFGSLKLVLQDQTATNKIAPYAFFYWTIPLILALMVSGGAIVGLFKGRSYMFRFMLILVSSVGLSMIWQFAITQLLGTTKGNLEDTVVYTWGAGTFLQLLFLEWRLPKSTEKKEPAVVVLGLISFPLTAVLSILIMSLTHFAGDYYNRPDAETYLIPADFKGEFRVVYSEKNGQKVPMEDGRRLLKIPSNGILIIQPEMKNGNTDQQFFLVDKQGNRKEISTIIKYNERLKYAPGVLFWGPGLPMQNIRNVPSNMKYMDFTLYRKDSKERNNEDYLKFQHNFDSLTAALVQQNRVN